MFQTGDSVLGNNLAKFVYFAFKGRDEKIGSQFHIDNLFKCHPFTFFIMLYIGIYISMNILV